MNSLRQYRKIERGESFVVFADTSAGMGDYCAAQFLSQQRLDIPLVYHKKVIATEMTNTLYRVLEELHDTTQIKPVVAYERNNGGLFELERLAAMNRLGKYLIFEMPNAGSVNNSEPTKIGWDTNTATRPKMLQEFKDAVDNKLVRIYDKPTITELYSFVLVQTNTTIKAQAERGAHDDLVMSGAGVWQLHQLTPIRTIERHYEPTQYQPADSIIGI